MRDILAKVLKRGQEAPPDESPREDVKRLADAKQEATSTRLRKDLLTREVQATIARLSR